VPTPPTPTPAGPQWITAPEVARRYGVSRRTLGRMLARGEIPYRKRGPRKQSRVVVHATALARLLDPTNAM
jgi:excisionase family DNA binding protein